MQDKHIFIGMMAEKRESPANDSDLQASTPDVSPCEPNLQTDPSFVDVLLKGPKISDKLTVERNNTPLRKTEFR